MQSKSAGSKFPQFLFIWENVSPSFWWIIPWVQNSRCFFFSQHFRYFTSLSSCFYDLQKVWYNAYPWYSIGKVSPLASFKSFYLSLMICSLNVIHLHGDFSLFTFILPDVLRVRWTQGLVSAISLGKLTVFMGSNFFCFFLLFFSSGIPTVFTSLAFVPQFLDIISFQPLFSLLFSSGISIDISLSSLSLPSAVSGY